MMKNKRKIQIGVMGSCSDLKYSKKVEKLAEEEDDVEMDSFQA